MERIKLLLRGFVTVFIFSAILFLCAGRLNYLQGWIFLAVNILTTWMNYFAIRHNGELINERSKPGEGIKSWDKLILGLSAIMYVSTIILAGLDTGRFHRSMEINWYCCVTGTLLIVTGQIIFLAARSQNRFFSSVVRIQKERGHVVCDTGLYKLIRHPGYLGMAISLMGLPLLTSSIWSIIPTALAIILLLARTSLEDKTLQNELDGYVEYTLKTRYRLLPYIW